MFTPENGIRHESMWHSAQVRGIYKVLRLLQVKNDGWQ